MGVRVAEAHGRSTNKNRSNARARHGIIGNGRDSRHVWSYLPATLVPTNSRCTARRSCLSLFSAADSPLLSVCWSASSEYAGAGEDACKRSDAAEAMGFDAAELGRRRCTNEFTTQPFATGFTANG